MKNIYIVSYAVKGIKNLSDWASLSFYKKTFGKDFNIQSYNVKAIYGANGAGKSAIIRSVQILKSIILDRYYLSIPMVQRQLGDLMNKQTQTLEIVTEFVVKSENNISLWRYEVKIGRKNLNIYHILNESLSFRNARSHTDQMSKVFQCLEGNLSFFGNDAYNETVKEQTKNLLSTSSLPSVWITQRDMVTYKEKNLLWTGIGLLILFAQSLTVSMEDFDDHSDYYVYDTMWKVYSSKGDVDEDLYDQLSLQKEKLNEHSNGNLTADRMEVDKNDFDAYEKYVRKLCEFLRIFKNDLKNIEIDKKEDEDRFLCTLVLCYERYRIDAEFESTGIKKLIRLYSYLDRMVNGEIVFIDEFDSNLHDVYLCALLEYLMEYGKGQLCFTTHNIGPMDVLKKNKKSIDFLSTDHKIYSWTTNGNYSPSKLYRSGMIEGSPFNVFPFDFINSFYYEGENE